ncbi:MAG: hypothetical protein L0922_04655, partial [Candidatus Mariimomonas ferrooxydans]
MNPDRDEKSSLRRETTSHRFIVPVIAILWCIFQLSIASWLILNSSYIRSIHLGFAIVIAYFSYPAVRRPTKGLFAFLSTKSYIPFISTLPQPSLTGPGPPHYLNHHS